MVESPARYHRDTLAAVENDESLYGASREFQETDS